MDPWLGRSVAFALGVIWWSTTLVVPAVANHLEIPSLWIFIACAFSALAIGTWKRSDTWLVLMFPSALLATLASFPKLLGSVPMPPGRWAVFAGAAVAYLFLVGVLSKTAQPFGTMSARAIASRRAFAPRWRQRNRIYGWLTLATLALPLYLGAATLFDKSIAGLMAESYPGRHAEMLTLFLLLVIGVAGLFFRFIVMEILAAHRTGDAAQVTALRQEASRAKRRVVPPTLIFWSIAGVALIMAYVVAR